MSDRIEAVTQQLQKEQKTKENIINSKLSEQLKARGASSTYLFSESDSNDGLNRRLTKGEGDCAFHATLGEWDGKQFVCNNIAEARKTISETIRNCSFDSPVYKAVREAIQHVIMNNENFGDEKIRKIKIAYQAYLQQNEEAIHFAWSSFEYKIKSYPDVLSYIDQHVPKTAGQDGSLRNRFQQCLNKNDGELYGIILSIEDLDVEFKKYNSKSAEDFNWGKYLDPEVIKAYAQSVEKLGYWLLPGELEIIAYAFNVTVEFYIKDRNTGKDRKIETYNPRAARKVDVFFNGRDHYERKATNEECKPKKNEHENNSENSSRQGDINQELFNSLIQEIFKVVEIFDNTLKEISDVEIKEYFEDFPELVRGSIQKIKELMPQKTIFMGALNAELEWMLKYTESRIGFIEAESSHYLEKIKVIDLLGKVTDLYLNLNKALDPKPMHGSRSEESEVNPRWRDDRLSLEQRLICKHPEISKTFMKVLEDVKKMSKLHRFKIPNRCFLSYAWAGIEEPHEKWIQPFLVFLREHLHKAGINATVDIKDNPAGGDIYQYMNGIEDTDCVIIVGTEALLRKHKLGTSAVCSELILINRRRAKNGDKKTFPILLSGDFLTALPAHFSMYTTVKDWREKSYLANLRSMLANIYGLGPDNVEYNALWVKFEEQYSLLMRGFSKEDVALQLEKEKGLKSRQKELDSQQAIEFFNTLNNEENLSQRHDKILKELKEASYYKQHDYIAKELELYIPPFNCDPESDPRDIPSSKGKGEETLTSLRDTVIRDFFHGKEKILLLKGGAGSGKTLFGCHLEEYCWNEFKNPEDPIVIYIYLPHIKDPVNNLVGEYFIKFGLAAEKMINMLKNRKQVYFVLDAYDEIPKFQNDPTNLKNLFASNQLFKWKEAKFIITCRTSFLNRVSDLSADHSYKKYFAPFEDRARYELLKIVQVALFSAKQIENYIDKYVEKRSQDPFLPTSWSVQEYKDAIQALPNIEELIRSPLLLRMTVQALPTIVSWHTAKKKNNPSAFVRITERDVFLAYLKDNLNRQEARLLQEKGERKIPSNIKVKFLEFLIGLSDRMKEENIQSVNYKFRPGKIDKGPGWARTFFGDPFLGKDENALKFLEMIRNNLTCFLVYEHETWEFIHSSFIEKFDSINTVELTNIGSRLALNSTLEELSDECIEEFARVLFVEEEGHYYLTGNNEWSSMLATTSDQGASASSSNDGLLFSAGPEIVANKFRQDSASATVIANSSYTELVRRAIKFNVHLSKNSAGNTALHLAFFGNQIDKIIIILQEIKKSDRNLFEALKIENNSGQTMFSLFNESQGKLPEAVQKLVEDLRGYESQDLKNLLDEKTGSKLAMN